VWFDASMITLLLGGARSGKSALAEQLVLAHPGAVRYLATAEVGDDDFAARVAAHRDDRDPRFTTVECGADLALALRDATSVPTLVDALGTWVATSAMTERWSSPSALRDAIDDLVAALVERDAATVLVSDEVGLGVHPETAVGRRFRDVIGTVNQAVAAVADEVWLVVAGRVLRLDRPTTTGTP
jgi:adenosyl cobinamide kinase/adenosyl cobinamide phosphate guanylyltransferase